MVSDAGYTHITFDNLENHLTKDSENGANNGQVMLVNKLLEALGIVDVEAHLDSDVNLLNLHQSIQGIVRLDLEPSRNSLLSTFAGASQEKLDEAFEQKCSRVSKLMILRNMVRKNPALDVLVLQQIILVGT